MLTASRTQLLLPAILSLITSVSHAFTPADSTGTGEIRRVEIYVGGSIKEVVHVGVSFGNRNNFGVYVGGWEGLLSTGASVKRYIQKKGHSGLLSSWFTRFAGGVLVEPGYDSYPASLALLYFSTTWGKDFYFGPTANVGLSLEGGIMFLPPSKGDSVNSDVGIPVLPSMSIKLFYKKRKRN